MDTKYEKHLGVCAPKVGDISGFGRPGGRCITSGFSLIENA